MSVLHRGYEWRCNFCPEVHVDGLGEIVQFEPGVAVQPMRPRLPNGWAFMSPYMIACPKHRVVAIDNAPEAE